MLPETTRHSSVRQSCCLCRIVPKCISSANARLDPAGSRLKACPPRRTRQPGRTQPVRLVCRTRGAAAAKSSSFIYSALLEIWEGRQPVPCNNDPID